MQTNRKAMQQGKRLFSRDTNCTHKTRGTNYTLELGLSFKWWSELPVSLHLGAIVSRRVVLTVLDLETAQMSQV